MRAAVNVQHLAGDLARLGEIEHGLGDVRGGRNLPKRRQRAQEVLRIVLEQRAYRQRQEPPRSRECPAFAYSIARLREIALIPPLVIIGTDAVNAASG